MHADVNFVREQLVTIELLLNNEENVQECDPRKSDGAGSKGRFIVAIWSG
ncbi:MAG: hypothetical protein LH478_04440 [Chitinophagaceae bacterium]|nr:hypothetical protein [Chitinophagaceae bacterium]